MKFFYSLIFLFSILQPLNAQNLEGRWKGVYDTHPTFFEGYVLLVIKLLPDSTYEIHSYTPIITNGKIDTMLVCKVNFTKLKKNYFKFQEVQSDNALRENLQTMYLKFKTRKGKLTLEGKWESATDNRYGKGMITFTKVDDWKEDVLR